MKDIISMTIGDIKTEIDNGIMRAVQSVGINVSKEELIEALELNEKLVRCKDCKKHNTHRCHMAYDFISTDDDDFCSYGERKDHE